MKRMLVVLCALLSGGGAYCQLIWDNSSLLVEGASGGSAVEAVFKYKNIGTQDIKFVEVKPSCGCTTTEVKDTVVKGGESGELRAKINIGDGPGGVDRKHIAIRTSDSDQPSQLEVIIKTPRIVGLSKKSFSLTGASKNDAVSLTPGDVNGVAILGVRTSDDRIQVSLKNNASEIVASTVEVTSDIKATVFLDIKLPDGTSKTIKLPVSVKA